MNTSAQFPDAQQGLRIVLTRSAEDCESWAAGLQARGLNSVSLPCIETAVLESATLRTSLNAALAEADWLVVTSQRGVTSLASLLDHSLPTQLRIAAVGRSTADRATALFGRTDLVPQTATAAGLADELAAQLKSGPTKIVLALAENAGDVLTDTLKRAGAQCHRFDVYRTIAAAARSERQTLSELGGNTVFLASPSAVLGFVNQVAIDDTARLVSIGPSTTAAIERAGLPVFAQAATPNLTGMLDAIKEQE